MPEGICNKCGETKELVFAGCVCGGCTDALDKQWTSSQITDWVLIAVTAYAPVNDIIEALKASLAGKPYKRLTPKAAGRWVYRNRTYEQVKSYWAIVSESQPPPGDWQTEPLSVGLADSDEIAHMRSLSAKWSNWPDTPFIRPATPEEIAQYDESLRKEHRIKRSQEVIYGIWKKWGFNESGLPLGVMRDADGNLPAGLWDDSVSQRAAQADEEVTRRLEQLDLVKYSRWLSKEPWEHAADETEVPVQPTRNPGRGLSQVAGMAGLKEQLMHEVIGPFREPDLYRRYRVSLPNGILFYGPPGCGKTYLGRSLAEELGWSFQYCRPSDVASPYIHDTVNRIRAVFSGAIEKAPSIVFIDEFEAFVPARSELGGHQHYKSEEVNEFLANLEGCAERNVLVIAATNEPEKIDPAVRRSGRFDKLILIPPPDAEARLAMLEFHLNDRPVETSLDTAGIATVLEGYSASDIKLLVDEAARMALKRTEPISTTLLLAALERVPASITADDMQRYSAFRSRGV